jgi:hypothetical protein
VKSRRNEGREVKMEKENETKKMFVKEKLERENNMKKRIRKGMEGGREGGGGVSVVDVKKGREQGREVREVRRGSKGGVRTKTSEERE